MPNASEDASKFAGAKADPEETQRIGQLSMQSAPNRLGTPQRVQLFRGDTKPRNLLTCSRLHFSIHDAIDVEALYDAG
jgi:hypothetical protein